MSGLNLLLQYSKDYERTHQTILSSLLKEPAFVQLAFQFDEKEYVVFWEYNRGMFDLGLGKDKDTPLVLIELKYHSSLSKGQLKKQASYLKEKNIKGYHILLGTSDFEFFKNDDWCELSEQSEQYSKKIGTKELIKILKEYQPLIKENNDFNELIVAYISLLEKECQLMQNSDYSIIDDKHLKFYCIYKKIQDRISDFYAKIYTVNNQGGASNILNDNDSWFPVNYNGNTNTFEVYHEILNGEYQIRLYSKTKDNTLIKELQNLLIEKLKMSEFHQYNLLYSGKVSKYTILARKPFNLFEQSEFDQAVKLFSGGHTWLREIAGNIKS